MLRTFIVKATLTAMCSLIPLVARATVHDISLFNFAISPKNTVVTLGDTVRWTNEGGTHTSTSDASSPKSWNSGVIGSGGTFQLIVTGGDPTGNYPYHCSIHSTQMIDTLRVVAPTSCCLLRGDANHNSALNVVDLNFLVAYFFLGGNPPDCLEEADANGDTSINVVDLNYLVSYFFLGGSSPADCS